MRNYSIAGFRHAGSGRLAFVATLTLVLSACGSGGKQAGGAGAAGGGQTPPTPVHTMVAQPHQVEVYAEYPGRVQGKQTAQIIGRVNGVLEAKHYQEGSIVHKGELLYTIDPRPYKATVDQRKAQVASSKASLANTSRIWERTQHLYKANAVSQAERDQALANYQSDQAAVQQAEANLESAQINLDYTSVQAPIAGVTSLREVDLGGLIKANQTELTTITQLDPVYVLFALPEDDAFARRKALAAMGHHSDDSTTREATIILSDGTTFPEKGKVDFTQSTIDPNTGTVQLRAILHNPDNTLMPGRYVRARVRIATLNAITVPDDAISDSGQQTQVFVNNNGKVKAVAIELGPDTDSGRVISKGLSQGDQVITSGLGVLKSGAAIKVIPDNQKTGTGDGSSDGGGDQNGGDNDPAANNG